MVFKKKQPTSNVVVGKKEKLSKRFLANKPKYIKIGASILLAALLFAGLLSVYFMMAPQIRDARLKDACYEREDIIAGAVKIIQADSVRENDETVKTIKTLDEYEKDPNCAYVLVVYSLKLGDGQAASKYYDQFKAHQGKDVPVSGKYGKLMTEQELKLRIEAQLKMREEAQNNAIYGPEVEQ